jgi:hypothetical protein
MKVIIDRFEGYYAVCEKEDRTMLNILKKDINGVAKEGDVLLIEGEQITIDQETTEKRKKEIEELTKGMWV